MDLFILAALILLNGCLAMSELALVTANRSRMERLRDAGDRAAARALRLLENPTHFLSTIQIGITAIGILNGIVGESALAEPLARLISEFGINPRLSIAGATFLVVALVTYFTIVVGELVPKRLAQANAEGIARIVAGPLTALGKIAHPFVVLLSVSTDTLLRLLGRSELRGSTLTEEDIYAVLAQGSAAGIIDPHEHEMVRKVFRLDDRPIASLMTPRSEIVYLDLEQDLATNLAQIMNSDHTHYPVCAGGIDNIKGIATTKRLLQQSLKGEALDVERYLDDAVFVPESLTGMKLLEQFRSSGTQMAFVIDEYGELQGLVTVHDVMEALAGEFKPEDPEDAWAVQREDGSWLLDGLTPIPELKDRLGVDRAPDEDKGRYHTLSGMIMWLIDRLPRTGDVVEWRGWRFEIVDLDGNRVDKVLASKISENSKAKNKSGRP